MTAESATVTTRAITASPRPISRRRLLLSSKTFMVGAVLLSVWIACAIFGGWIEPHSPYATAILGSNRPPSWTHLFGTDLLGRDVFSRVVAGARDILTVAPLAALLATGLGTVLGLVAGFYGGRLDAHVMQVVDAFLAIPVVILALLTLAALGSSNLTVIAVIAIAFAPQIARSVRSAVQSERELEYVEAARLRCEHAVYVMFVEILPNIMALIVVEFTVRIGYAVFAIATLSFLGFGIQPPSPDWGLQIADSYVLVNGGIWWSTLFPALAIASLVVSVCLVSDGLTGVLDK